MPTLYLHIQSSQHVPSIEKHPHLVLRHRAGLETLQSVYMPATELLVRSTFGSSAAPLSCQWATFMRLPQCWAIGQTSGKMTMLIKRFHLRDADSRITLAKEALRPRRFYTSSPNSSA